MYSTNALRVIIVINNLYGDTSAYSYYEWIAKLYKNNGEDMKACEAAKVVVNMNQAMTNPDSYKEYNENLIKDYCGE